MALRTTISAEAGIGFPLEASKMGKDIKRIADQLGAKVMGRVPDTGAGAFGAARMARIIENLHAPLVPALSAGRASRQRRAQG
jgi:hypothetical protein